MTNSVCPSFGRRCSTSFLRPRVIAQAGLSMCQGVGSPDLSRLLHEPWSQGYLPDLDACFTPCSRPEEISTIIRDPPMDGPIPVTWPLFFSPNFWSSDPGSAAASRSHTRFGRCVNASFTPERRGYLHETMKTTGCLHPKKESVVWPRGIPARFSPR